MSITAPSLSVLDPVIFIAALAGERSVQEISLFAADAQRLLVGEKPPAAKVAQQARELGIGLAMAESSCSPVPARTSSTSSAGSTAGSAGAG